MSNVNFGTTKSNRYVDNTNYAFDSGGFTYVLIRMVCCSFDERCVCVRYQCFDVVI